MVTIRLKNYYPYGTFLLYRVRTRFLSVKLWKPPAPQTANSFFELILQVTIGVFGRKKQVWGNIEISALKFVGSIFSKLIFTFRVLVAGLRILLTLMQIRIPLYTYNAELLLIKLMRIRAAITLLQTLHGSICAFMPPFRSKTPPW
jgi:hypothetical protein